MSGSIFRIYEFTNYQGGEDIWLTRITSKLNAELLRFWDLERNCPSLKPSGILNAIIYAGTRLIAWFSPGLAKGLYSLFGIYTYRITNKSKVNIVSTTFIPVPSGKNIVAYVHTPSRLLTIYHDKEKERYSKHLFSRIYFFMWRRVYYRLYTKSMKRCEIIYSNSRNTQNRLKSYFNVESDVMYPSQNTNDFKCKGFEKFFFYPSRITPPKRQMYVLRAFQLFFKSNKEFKLILAGTIPAGNDSSKYAIEVKQFIEEHELPVELKLDLSREAIIEVYSKAYLCLFAGEDEDFGQVPIETMASSKPIISVKEGGPRESILDGITGFLVSSEEEMSRRMIDLASNLEKNIEMGKKGHEHVKVLYSDENFVSKMTSEIKKHGILKDLELSDLQP